MGHDIAEAVVELPARTQVTTSPTITEACLAGLPEPMRRYLTYARVIGKAPIPCAGRKPCLRSSSFSIQVVDPLSAKSEIRWAYWAP
jgi:hypothetical protein